MSESFGADPVLPAGLRRRLQRDRLSLLPRSAAARCARARPPRGSSGSRSTPIRATLSARSARLGPVPRSESAHSTTSGTTRWGSVVVRAGWSNRCHGPARPRIVGRAVASRRSAARSRRSGWSSRRTARPYELSGSLSSAVVPGPWQVAGFSQGYAVFTSAPSCGSDLCQHSEWPPLAVTVVSRRPSPSRSASTRRVPATVVRSVAWDPGWTASVSVDGKSAAAVRVGSVDLVQQVQDPARARRRHVPLPAAASRLASVLSLGAGGPAALALRALARGQAPTTGRRGRRRRGRWSGRGVGGPGPCVRRVRRCP